MQNALTLINSSEIEITPEKREQLKNALQKGHISHLAPDKEGGPFMLYMLGNSFDLIAQKTSYPIDVILVTAIHYQWANKVKSINELNPATEADLDVKVKRIQKDLLNTMLIATYQAILKDVGDIASGRKDLRACKLLPQNSHSLEKLMNMINAMNEKPSVQTGTLIQGQNIQVINHAPDKIRLSESENKAMLQTLEEESEE